MPRSLLLSFVSAAALAGALTAADAAAAQNPARAAAKNAGGIETIIVTARRREENLQQTPVAISAFKAADLIDMQAVRLDDLQGAAPNLNIVAGRGSNSSVNIFIRGIGQPDALQTFDPAVGLYVDGVYMSRIQGALFGLEDIERVEVLRGPQGALYGKNSIGGAINLTPRKPDDDVRLIGALHYGKDSAMGAGGYVSGPLRPGKLAASFAVSYHQRDGIVADPLTGASYNDEQTLALRTIFRLTPSEDVELRLSADYANQDTGLSLGRLESDLIQTDLGDNSAKILSPAPGGAYDFKTATSFSPGHGQTMTHWGLALHAEWRLNDMAELVSISAYRSLKPHSYIDIDATQYEVGDVKVFVDQKQYSQELQLKVDDGAALHGVIGLYYLHEKVSSDQAAYADDLFSYFGAPVDFQRSIGDDLKTDSYAAFGQATYDLTDRLSITAGLRYTSEKKDYFRAATTSSAALPALDGSFAFADQKSWDAVTPSLTVDFKATAGNLLYASVGRGFKSGGFNGRANSARDTGAFDPEYVWTYELGSKNGLFDNRLRFNAAIFYNDYTDFQARVGGVTAGDFPVLNAGDLETYGAEAELTAIPMPGLRLSGALGYLQADYKTFFDSRYPNNDHSSETPPFAPKWNGRLAASYEFAAGDSGWFSFGGDLRYVGKHYLSVDNRPGLIEDGYALLGGFARWDNPEKTLAAILSVKNLTDRVYKLDGQEFSNVGNIQTAYYGDPMTWMLNLRADF